MSEYSSISSSDRAPDPTIHKIPFLPVRATVGLFAAFAAVVLIAVISFLSLQASTASAARVTRTIEVLQHIENVLSELKDAETGQRGFLLTGSESYLDPYTGSKASLASDFEILRGLLDDAPEQQRRLKSLQQLAADKVDELGQTIALRRAGQNDAALALVHTDRGKEAMDRFRSLIAEMESSERADLALQQTQAHSAAEFGLTTVWAGATLLLLLIVVTGLVMSRDYRVREINVWLRTGQVKLAERLQGDQRLGELGDKTLVFIARYLDAQIGAIFLREDAGHFHRIAGYALDATQGMASLTDGQGLVGQAARENRVIHVNEVPAGYLTIVSGVGQRAPGELLLAPASVDGVVYAVVELGFFRQVSNVEREFLARASEALGIAIRSAADRTKLELLLEETQRQAEELQAQQEELRVQNEELGEQSRVLKESQNQLEHQQAELEQTNSQLEEQAQTLEKQKDYLRDAQTVLASKAADLERVNQYKSEFLANMSHELRTPLNSTLILAKLLADNKGGNLSDEQIRFAQTISSAGNDLLALINDILDLSRIESGKFAVQIEPVFVTHLIDGLMRGFQPAATEKQLELVAVIDPAVPNCIDTDNQRLAQILRNLISNALKFTHAGRILLHVGFIQEKSIVTFGVRDSGIGIAPAQQELIFEAFRQADGSTHRKYGGTGLGLSISRDLARLLGGDITVQSDEGMGSSFTLTLPIRYTAAASSDPAAGGRAGARRTSLSGAVLAVPPEPLIVPKTVPTISPVADLKSTDRLILIIEDDVRFADILRELADEMGFASVAAHTANEGLAAASSYQPKAILLDMNLPDHSGLGVLDQLKRNPQTRHIPVHVISVADYAQEALELGAVGYALKPVKREELVDALRRLETKFSQTVRRVLVVEDDVRQGESIRHLLGDSDIQITVVQLGAQALSQLETTTFDCVVMDLNLHDMSGYELLEKMAGLEGISFPPVIVYTGRLLSRDEEHALHRFSKAIIIKDARSPERLLDEVTLFLHQVESKLPMESQRMLKDVRKRDATLEDRCILVVEDDVRNIFALSSVLEGKGAKVEIARNGIEALASLTRSTATNAPTIDMVLMDIMMPEMDGITAMREIRKRADWKRLPIIALTAKAMKDDQEKCLAAGANDYIAKPLDVEKLLSLIRVWMPKN